MKQIKRSVKLRCSVRSNKERRGTSHQVHSVLCCSSLLFSRQSHPVALSCSCSCSWVCCASSAQPSFPSPHRLSPALYTASVK